MTTNFKAINGLDLDSIFTARVNAARANVGFLVGAQDLAQRFESYSSGTQAAPTGFTAVGGSDLNALFSTGILTSHSMTAGTNSGLIGYGTAASTFPMGSLSPGTIGGYTVARFWYSPAFACAIEMIGTPPNSDAVFKELRVTGVFSDSGGSSVTRTLTRASASSGMLDAVTRQWQWAANAVQFINGNAYTVVDVR